MAAKIRNFSGRTSEVPRSTTSGAMRRGPDRRPAGSRGGSRHPASRSSSTRDNGAQHGEEDVRAGGQRLFGLRWAHAGVADEDVGCWPAGSRPNQRPRDPRAPSRTARRAADPSHPAVGVDVQPQVGDMALRGQPERWRVSGSRSVQPRPDPNARAATPTRASCRRNSACRARRVGRRRARPAGATLSRCRRRAVGGLPSPHPSPGLHRGR